jgi:hypothetical protein
MAKQMSANTYAKHVRNGRDFGAAWYGKYRSGDTSGRAYYAQCIADAPAVTLAYAVRWLHNNTIGDAVADGNAVATLCTDVAIGTERVANSTAPYRR